MPELARLDDAAADLTAAFGRSLAAVARPGETWLLDGPGSYEVEDLVGDDEA